MQKIILLLFFTSCSFHSANKMGKFDHAMEDARRGWKTREKEENIIAKFKEAYQYAVKDNDSDRKSLALHEWGRYYLAKKKIDMGKEKFLQSLTLDQSSKNLLGIYLNSHNLAYIYYEEKKNNRACDYLQAAKKALIQIYSEELYEDRREAMRSRLNHFSDNINCNESVL